MLPQKSERVFIAILVVAGLVHVGGSVAHADQILVGVSGDGVLWDVDPATGWANNPRFLEHGVSDLAATRGGTLYGSSAQYGALGGGVFRIDTFDATTTRLVSHEFVSFDVGFLESTGSVVGIERGSGDLFSINPVTGQISVIEDVLPGSGPLAIDRLGRGFALITEQGTSPDVADRIVQIDPLTGGFVRDWVLDIDLRFASSAFIDDLLYIVDVREDRSAGLYRFSPASGEIDLVGEMQLTEPIIGLAAIPEPATLVLTSVGMLFAARRGRR